MNASLVNKKVVIYTTIISLCSVMSSILTIYHGPPRMALSIIYVCVLHFPKEKKTTSYTACTISTERLN